jgi:cytochrome c553
VSRCERPRQPRDGRAGAPIAGLPAGSIEAVLAQYKAGQGGNAIMQSIARALSPAETVAVANYFSALPKP